MPSSTPQQAKFMGPVAHNPQFAAKVGVPQKVGQDFNKADQLAKAKALRKTKPPSIGGPPPSMPPE